MLSWDTLAWHVCGTLVDVRATCRHRETPTPWGQRSVSIEFPHDTAAETHTSQHHPDDMRNDIFAASHREATAMSPPSSPQPAFSNDSAVKFETSQTNHPCHGFVTSSSRCAYKCDLREQHASAPDVTTTHFRGSWSATPDPQKGKPLLYIRERERTLEKIQNPFQGAAVIGPQTCLPPRKASILTFTSCGSTTLTAACHALWVAIFRRTASNQAQSCERRISRTVAWHLQLWDLKLLI